MNKVALLVSKGCLAVICLIRQSMQCTANGIDAIRSEGACVVLGTTA
jgi:hypothetical protein